MSADNVQPLEATRKFPYTLVLSVDDEGDTIARLLEIPGCIAHGKDAPESMERISGMLDLWLLDMGESGELRPTPLTDSQVAEYLHAKGKANA